MYATLHKQRDMCVPLQFDAKIFLAFIQNPIPNILGRKMEMGQTFVRKKIVKKNFLDVLDTVFPKNTLKNTHFFVSSEKWPSAKMVYVYNGSSDSKLLYRISKFSQSATKNCLKKGPNTFVKRNPSNSKKKVRSLLQNCLFLWVLEFLAIDI